MEIVTGTRQVTDLEGFLDRLDAIGDTHACVIQAMDARYVAGEAHLQKAVELARRGIEAGAAIADDPAMEILLYVAGTRQIQRALDIGVTEGEPPIAIVIDGGDEAAAAAATKALLDPADGLLEPDEARLTDWFDISAAEQAATDASLESLVCERVALLVLER